MGTEYWIFCKTHKEAFLLGKGSSAILGEKVSDDESHLPDDVVKKIYDDLDFEDVPKENLIRKMWERQLFLIDEFIKTHHNCEKGSCTDLYNYIWQDEHYRDLPGWSYRKIWDDEIFKTLYSEFNKDWKRQHKQLEKHRKS